MQNRSPRDAFRLGKCQSYVPLALMSYGVCQKTLAMARPAVLDCAVGCSCSLPTALIKSMMGND